ncbi:MAG: hypothetical protein QG665_222 [Patescibacteria group bacterium]|nr:hypothetical protein [Patescibacteria group bacterium]
MQTKFISFIVVIGILALGVYYYFNLRTVSYPIPEFGISLRTPKWLADDLIYEKSTTTGSIILGSKRLVNIAPSGQCQVKDVPIGAITSTPGVKGEVVEPGRVTQFKDFYITVYTPQDRCSVSEKVTKIQFKIVRQFEKSSVIKTD